jgi:hypothetical protein
MVVMWLFAWGGGRHCQAQAPAYLLLRSLRHFCVPWIFRHLLAQLLQTGPT